MYHSLSAIGLPITALSIESSLMLTFFGMVTVIGIGLIYAIISPISYALCDVRMQQHEALVDRSN